MAVVTVRSKLKELLNHGLIFGLTSSLQNVLGFVLLPVLTSYFTPSSFGIYSIILLISSLASAIFYFGASSALGRFYYEYDNDVYRSKIISAALTVTFLGAVTLISLGCFFGRVLSESLFHTAAYSLHIKISLAGVAFAFLLNTMTLILRYSKKSIMFMFVIITGVIMNFAITYTLLRFYRMQLLAPIYGAAISSFLSFICLFAYYINKLTVRIEKKHLHQIFSFGLQASLTGLLFYLLDWVDRLILKDLLPMADVGIYSLGYRIGAIINVLLVTPFSLIWAPIRMEYAKNENNKHFISKVTSYFSVAGLSVILVATLFAADFMHLFFNNNGYYAAAKVYPIIMLSILFFGLQNIVDFGIYLHKKVYFYIIISGAGLIINVCLNYIFIPKFGYIAAAYVTLITYFITTLSLYLISSRYFKFEIQWTKILGPLIFLMVVYLSYNQFYVVILHTFLAKCLVLFLGIILLYYLWLQKNERLALKNFFSK